MIKQIYCLSIRLFLAMLSCSPAMAGNESHGGDIVLCKGKDPIVLDYFHAALKGFGEIAPNITDLSIWSRDQVVAFFREKLRPFVFNERFEHAISQVGSLDDWIEADLKDVDDSDEPYLLPKDCERAQGAVRKGNEMYVDPTYVRKLSHAQEGILVVHEAAYFIATQQGQRTSVHVRELVRNVLRKDTPLAKLLRSIHSLGGIAYAFGALPTRRYISRCGGQSPNIFFGSVDATRRTMRAMLHDSGEMLPYPPAEISCDTSGLRCTITKPTTNANSVLAWKDATVEIKEDTRRITFTGQSNECDYTTSSSSPHFP